MEGSMVNPFDVIMQKLCDLEEEMRMMRLGSATVTSAPVHRSKDEVHLSVQEIADSYKLAKSTILRYARTNVIPSYKAGKSYTFKKSEVDRALSSMTPLKRNKRGGNAQ
jgi:excisionase family DNA binding protein